METLDFNECTDKNKRLIFDLTTMLEIGKTLNSSLSLNDVLDIIILTCNGHFHASDAFVILSTELEGQAYFSYKTQTSNVLFGPTHPLIRFIKENQRPIQIIELKKQPELRETFDIFNKDDVDLIVPLRFRGQINGILCLKKKEKEFGKEYSKDEKRFIDIIAGFASVAIENARLYEMATLDRKTKLYNHGYFQNRLLEEIERAERYKTDLSLMMLDLDHFKNINDTYGHMVGDEVLIKIARVIREQLRSFDIPARFGGEEFTVILPETDLPCTVSVAERLRKAVEKLSFSSPKGSFSVTVSIGVTGFIHSSGTTEDIFIEEADRALYYAKQHGRNQVVSYPGIVPEIAARN